MVQTVDLESGKKEWLLKNKTNELFLTVYGNYLNAFTVKELEYNNLYFSQPINTDAIKQIKGRIIDATITCENLLKISSDKCLTKFAEHLSHVFNSPHVIKDFIAVAEMTLGVSKSAEPFSNRALRSPAKLMTSFSVTSSLLSQAEMNAIDVARDFDKIFPELKADLTNKLKLMPNKIYSDNFALNQHVPGKLFEGDIITQYNVPYYLPNIIFGVPYKHTTKYKQQSFYAHFTLDELSKEAPITPNTLKIGIESMNNVIWFNSDMISILKVNQEVIIRVQDQFIECFTKEITSSINNRRDHLKPKSKFRDKTLPKKLHVKFGCEDSLINIVMPVWTCSANRSHRAFKPFLIDDTYIKYTFEYLSKFEPKCSLINMSRKYFQMQQDQIQNPRRMLLVDRSTKRASETVLEIGPFKKPRL